MLNDLIANGTYAKVLKAWNLTSEGIETSQINPRDSRSPESSGARSSETGPQHA